MQYLFTGPHHLTDKSRLPAERFQVLASVLKTIPFFLRSESRSLENFDFSFNLSIKRTKIYELAAGQFVRQHRDVLLVGPAWCSARKK